MASTLSELLDYVRENERRVYRNANQIKINPDSGQIGFLIDGQTVSDPYPWEWHDISMVALRNLAHMFDIPPAYISRVPQDLAALNINYLTSRSDRPLTFSLTEDVVSEVKSTENDRTIFEIIDAVKRVYGDDDPCVIQADIRADRIQFITYLQNEDRTPLGDLHRGFSVVVPVSKKKDVHSEPVIVNSIDETAIEFAVHHDENSTDFTNMTSMFTIAHDHMNSVDDVIMRNAGREISDTDYFVSKYGAKNGVTTSGKRCVREEILNEGLNDTCSVASAVMRAEERTKSPLQFMKLARLAADAFYSIDPVYCDHCHQEIPDEETQEDDEIEE